MTVDELEKDLKTDKLNINIELEDIKLISFFSFKIFTASLKKQSLV